MSVAGRLEAARYGPFHRRLLLMGGLAYSFDGLDVAMLGFVYPALARLWRLDAPLIGLIGSATFVGYFFGAVGAGLIADRTGRRRVMLGALVLYTTFSLASALCGDWRSFMAMRLLAGVGVGAQSAIVAPFLSEFVSSRYRGLFVGALASFFSFGFVGAALASAVVLPQHPDAWRWMLAATVAPILLLPWWRAKLPESPRWLASVGRKAEAEAVLARMGAPEAPEGAPEPAGEAPSTREAFALLFSPALIRVTLMSWLLWSSITASYYAFFTWLPGLVLSSHIGGKQPFLFTAAIYCAQIPGYFSGAVMNERIGRRETIVLYITLGALAALGFAVAHPAWLLLLAGVVLSFAMNGTYAGVYAYTPEVFPTRVRATGVGLASAVGRLGAVGSPLMVGLLYPRFGLPGVFAATTAILACGAVGVLILGVSTKGRSLEEIATAQV